MYILVVLLNPLGIEPVVPESALARVGLVFFAAIDAARRMRTRQPRRGSLGWVFRVATPGQTTMYVLLVKTSAVRTLAELGPASCGGMPEVPATLATRDSGMGGGRIDGAMPAHNGKGAPYEAPGSCSSPGVSDVKVHHT